VDEVLDQGVRDFLAHHFWQKVKMVIVPDYYRRQFVISCLVNHGTGKGLVHRHVAALPGVMYAGVHIWVVGRVPHVVLQEPEQRIAEYVVKLVIYAPGSDNVPQAYLVARKGGLVAGTLRGTGNQPVALTHGAGNPGELGGLRQGV
jgi:hypothetical protein